MSDSSLKIILCLLIVLSMSYKRIVEHLFNLASQVSARIRGFLPYHMYLIYYLKKKKHLSDTRFELYCTKCFISLIHLGLQESPEVFTIITSVLQIRKQVWWWSAEEPGPASQSHYVYISSPGPSGKVLWRRDCLPSFVFPMVPP